jgi:23S rRNA (uracil1939-C5)-methyltransferase
VIILDTSWIHIGDQIELEIRKQGINGEGIGYHNKLAIFVFGAIAQEIVVCEITQVFPTYANAKIHVIKQPSLRRVEAPCPYYDRCGGCQMQHIEYNEQLKIKQSILKQALKRYTTLDVDRLPILKTLGNKPGFHYRNKSQMPFRNTTQGLQLGLFQPGTNHFVGIPSCLVQEEMVNRVNQLALELCHKYQLSAIDSQHKDGILLHLVTRHLSSTNQVQVTFVVTKKIPILTNIANELIKLEPKVVSVHVSVNSPNSVQIFGRSTTLLVGSPSIVETISGLHISLSPEAFHQLNSYQMGRMYDAMIKIAAIKPTDVVIDAFCGVGITSLQIAKIARKVIGIDYSEVSIQDAQNNAKTNQVSNVRFIAEKVERALPQYIVNNSTPDVIVFDPPRTGLDESMIQLLIKTRIPKVVYISCNPSTLAKNIASLAQSYQVKQIQPIDMFPHTASVESITLLELI